MLNGLLAGHTDEEVNLVNAPSLAEQRGIQVSERKEQSARDFTDLVRVTVVAGGERTRVVGTTLGRQHRPHLLEAWGQRFNLQMDEGHLALFHYQDVPGMIGRVGTVFGQHGVNISSAAVGREPPGYDSEDARRPGRHGGHHRRADPARRDRRDRGDGGLRRRPLGGARGLTRIGSPGG